MISEMDQEDFAEVDRDNCALKLTQRRKNKGKVTIKFYSYIKNKTCTQEKEGWGGRGGNGSMGKEAK